MVKHQGHSKDPKHFISFIDIQKKLREIDPIEKLLIYAHDLARRFAGDLSHISEIVDKSLRE
jgi:hypothetical protein